MRRESQFSCSHPVIGRSGCRSQGREFFVNRTAILKLGVPKSWNRKET